MKLNNKYIIGCHVMFYEIDMVEEYLNSVHLALQDIDNKENVKVEMMWNMSQYFEQSNSMQSIYAKIEKLERKYDFVSLFYEDDDKPYTMADYRRELNNQCNECDYVIWGESDCLMPRQMFGVLEQLKEYANSQGVHRYITTFGIRKMWDDSWRVLEHPEFTDKPFYDSPDDFKPDEHWWSLRYSMNIDEMNSFNDKVEDLDIRVLNQHKFNGCGLVISSEVIKAGVNIPRSVFFVHEDTSFMIVLQKLLGLIPQYIIKNILLVHNRNHPKKRMYVKDERLDGTMNEKRRSNDWYVRANEMSEKNCYNSLNPNYKAFTWDDVWK